MSAVDTIVILNGLMQQKETTSDAFTCDGDGSDNSCVGTYTVKCPNAVSGVRVIFNNNHDVGGAARVHVRVRMTKLTSMADGTPTKTENTQLLEWTAVAAWAAGDPAAGVQETGAEDISAAIEAILHIDCCISEAAVAHTGTEIICQAQHENALDEWTTFAQFIGPTGTAFKVDFAAQEAAAQTTLSVTNPTAANFNHVPKFIFLEDTAAIEKSEIAYQTDFGADA